PVPPPLRGPLRAPIRRRRVSLAGSAARRRAPAQSVPALRRSRSAESPRRAPPPAETSGPRRRASRSADGTRVRPRASRIRLPKRRRRSPRCWTTPRFADGRARGSRSCRGRRAAAEAAGRATRRAVSAIRRRTRAAGRAPVPPTEGGPARPRASTCVASTQSLRDAWLTRARRAEQVPQLQAPDDRALGISNREAVDAARYENGQGVTQAERVGYRPFVVVVQLVLADTPHVFAHAPQTQQPDADVGAAEEIGHEVARGLRKHLERRSALYDTARVQQNDARGETRASSMSCVTSTMVL